MTLLRAREHAENGEHAAAVTLFTEALESPDRAEAALGLALVLEDLGDIDGSRVADQIAIDTEDPDYAPRAAYHLALSYERAGDLQAAAGAWRNVVELGNPDYLPAACLALAQLADDRGDTDAALAWWEQAVDSGDEEYAPVAAHDLSQRLLELGQAARAQTVLATSLRRLHPDSYAYARLAIVMGLTHLEQAIGAFSAALGPGTAPDLAPLATELLARTLPLRGRDEESVEVWRRGLADPAIAADVEARINRELPAV
ncbi:tetratricopeptide repeat protein [Actinocorallia longicatena]|uniref:Tetratricopeptide repeat protein n=1 Tax=Actinocorallia longicatena TaxID=111803 RepID=A0ABP6PW38_9ACTN